MNTQKKAPVPHKTKSGLPVPKSSVQPGVAAHRAKQSNSSQKTQATHTVNPTKGKTTGGNGKPGLKAVPVRWINCFMVLLFLAFALFMTLGTNAEFLRRMQLLDLFVADSTFFAEKMVRPGGFIVWAGCFLTQFFEYPWLGTLVYLLVSCLLLFVTARAFRFKGPRFSWSLVPELLLLLTFSELGYLLFSLKVDGFTFVPILGTLMAFSGVWLYRSVSGWIPKLLSAMLFLTVGYYLAGAWALMGGLFLLTDAIRDAFRKGNSWTGFLPVAVIVVLVLVFPMLICRVLQTDIHPSQVHLINLPGFEWTGKELVLWLPYGLFALFGIIASSGLLNGNSENVKTGAVVVPVVACLATGFLVWSLSFRDQNFRTELVMLTAIEEEDWGRVVNEASKTETEPTRLMVMSTNLALFKEGVAGDKAYQFRNGNKPINCPRLILPVNIAAQHFYYEYGQLNYCYRWCMEDMVEYGANVTQLKYFVKSSLLNGDLKLAKKYNDLLHKTLFHRKWAERFDPFIDKPETAIKDPGMAHVRSLMVGPNVLDGDHYMMEQFLRNYFADLNDGPPVLLELSMLSILESKTIAPFWPRLFYWANTQKRIPVHFQEAALLYNYLEHKFDLTGFPFDPAVVTNFQSFQDLVSKYASYPEETSREIFRLPFGKTFWFYYFFVKDEKPTNEGKKQAPYLS